MLASDSLALYFSIYSSRNNQVAKRYHDALKSELEHFLGQGNILNVSSVYIALQNIYPANNLILDILATLRSAGIFKNCCEITIELPSGKLLTEQNIRHWRELGVNRINLQGNVPRDFEWLLRTSNQLSQFFNNIAIDICMEDTISLLQKNVIYNMFISGSVKHVTIQISQVLEKMVADAFECLRSLLCSCGLIQYELVNFAYQDFQSHYMCHLWDQKSIRGFGAQAQSFMGFMRYSNERLSKYISCIEKRGSAVRGFECLRKDQYVMEYIMLNLRRDKGIYVNRVTDSLDKEKRQNFLYKLDMLVFGRLLQRKKDYYSLTLKGQLFESEIIKNLTLNN